MNLNYKHFIITFLISVTAGCGATFIVASSDNGYVAGFVFLPLFFLICFATLILFTVALFCFGYQNKFAPWILLSAILLPGSFVSSAMFAKHFEIGAYYQEPMIPLDELANNIVLFKKGTSEEQISEFWNKTMSSERADGRGYTTISGVRTIWRIQSRNGHEEVAFGFFPNATEEQRQFVLTKVKSSPIVYQFLENESLNQQSDNNNLSPNIKIYESK